MINCEKAYELIQLHFGYDELPEDLLDHLAKCDSCRTYYDEMMSLAGDFGSDVDLPFTAEDIDRAVAVVEGRIDRQPTVVFSPAKWLRPILRVAAVLMVVGLSYSSYQLGLESNFNAGLDTLQTADAEVDRLAILLEYDADEEIDEGMIGILIDDYCSVISYEATASLLDDISEEELEYLTENLEVGELL